jgi:1,4-dihydroxy-2-naphthoyl-CoA hydrolase
VFELFHDAYAAMVEDLGVEYESHFGISAYATPIVHAEADYRRPIRPGEHLVVEVRVERVGESSFSLGFRIVDGEGVERATGHETHVTIDPSRFASIPLPDNLRAALTSFGPE